MEECRKDLCNKCAIRFWCDHRMDHAENREALIQRFRDAVNPNFIVR